MGEGQKEKKTGKWPRHSWLLVLGAAVGLCLVLLGNSEVFPNRNTEKDTSAAESDPLAAYVTRTEEKIAALCESVQGVSGVQVAVTLEGDFTYVYATEHESEERDGVCEEKVTYVTVGSGANESPILLTRTYPRVSGIGIVCRGGGDATVRREILALLTAGYGISSNQIYIAEAKE